MIVIEYFCQKYVFCYTDGQQAQGEQYAQNDYYLKEQAQRMLSMVNPKCEFVFIFLFIHLIKVSKTGLLKN